MNPNTAPPVAKLANVTILCVEDEPMTRDFLSKMLLMRYPEHTVHTAENGKEGLDLFMKSRAEVVVTDISMPVMDGIQMAREIRLLNPDAQIIALSAHSPSDESSPLFTAYIIKPFVSKMLFDAIEECVARATATHP